MDRLVFFFFRILLNSEALTIYKIIYGYNRCAVDDFGVSD